jgi:WD40 repeat protein
MRKRCGTHADFVSTIPDSTPRIVWRPDGSGVYVSSDDGVVRGIEAKTGKIIASLQAHEPGSKLRCLWAGHIQTKNVDNLEPTGTNEYLLSGGFDQKLILWSAS